MKFRIRFAEQITGLFILAAIGALALILILMGPNQRWFKKDYYFYTFFNSANGLKRGQPIRMKGLQIGIVDNFGMIEDSYIIRMDFHIYSEEVHRIKSSSLIELITNPLNIGGGLVMYTDESMYLQIRATVENQDKGTKKDPIYIPSKDTKEGRELFMAGLVDFDYGDNVINDTIAKVQNTLSYIENVASEINNEVKKVDSILTNIDSFSRDIRDADGLVPRLLRDKDGFYENLTATAANIREASNNLSTELKRILQNVARSTANLNKFIANIGDVEGIIPKMLGKTGSVGSLFNDNNQIYNDIVATVKSLERAMKELGEFAAFINSTSPQITEILKEGQDALDEGKDVLEGLSNNPLIRGGITEEREQSSTFQSFRDEDF
ncbi:MAG: MCE family protein [Spirochaetales bacterium]|nr:MCE family protein [Spirochaetales bacterium]